MGAEDGPQTAPNSFFRSRTFVGCALGVLSITTPLTLHKSPNRIQGGEKEASSTIMTPYCLPPIETVPKLAASERAAILDHLFEPSESLHRIYGAALGGSTFSNYGELISDVQLLLEKLSQSSATNDIEILDDILGSHPRLGEKGVESAQSRAEQAQLAPQDNSESVRLAEMNNLYEKTFPGLRYVIFVNGRSRSIILEDMQTRINRCDLGLERAEAINAICDIASDRARKLSDQPAVT